MRYSIIGGDLRNIHVYHILKEEGHDVRLGGFSNYNVPNISDMGQLVKGSEIVIGPTPCLGVDRGLNCPLNKDIISFEELINEMDSSQIFVAGRVPKDKYIYAGGRNIRAFDILERDEMSILNAIPTAEGALSIAIEKSEVTIFDSNVLVMGFGRVGKILCRMLYGVGAKVFVLTRSPADQAFAKAYGYTALDFNDFNKDLYKMDIIINTIPFIVLDDKNLIYIKKDCILIELASKPFGIDAQFCRENNLSITFAPSLPGKVAPVSAAKYIVQTIKNIISEIA
ncbi:MAG: dipicolinate synthase subunit DpsA [Clostridiales bacterium]|jgi:dipicolinate synthase subunit A|nr:dipicolinate synthase subunit DpsA [Clostridiales bacterium]